MAKRIVILGSGESGTGAALLALQKGFEVFVSDKGSIPQKYKDELDQMGAAYEENQHTESLILNADEVIKSPGIPEKNELIQALRKKGTPIINEIEFASRYTQAKKLCITGTNGKTTTTSLTYHLLQKAGLNVAVAGNIGISMCRMVATGNYDYFVLEISSFQLDDMYDFKADIAVICNITPDHLDRYNYELQNYVRSKFRITRNQDENDLFIYCADDELTVTNIEMVEGNARKLPFSHDREMIPGAFIQNQEMKIQLTENQSNQFTMYTTDLTLRGRHNAYNSMAAAMMANSLGIRKDVIREGLMDFQNVEHRLEHVAVIRGVDFINDSKATNVNSAWYALESMDKPTIWVVGGIDKGNDYEMLKELVKSKVRIIVCLGLDNTKIHEAFSTDVDMIFNTTSAQEAVHVAAKMSKPGETVLLSPACASFDLFKNYEDRGRQFKAAVRSL
ncbi:MAG: UDP-N-acetylmuramoyl-L-alanine--D-glutamate ligase [Bacteroidia bacterium]|nr:UDP-N-acetylmuramoyl-L-alanine--D-glutamate ligase [Bacteroidia bacterium]MCF8426911.1 UDP-N-acetylmuramoyl-L-alanine--D-glutamate ligase [Bacteroidia bacterium]MCF8448082.1 UDP-N-acetylmuramoyl-L-alanine--D-glutamate ligase [Bacteroidia bacterium]